MKPNDKALEKGKENEIPLVSEGAKDHAVSAITKSICFMFKAIGIGLFLLLASRSFSWLYHGA